MKPAAPERLSTPRVLALSSLAIPLSGIGLPVSVYLSPFYAEEVGLGVALTGILFMVLRFWDLLIDPIVGFLIDRVNSRFGRARPWVTASVPILMLATYFIYMPPREGAGALYFIVWMLIFYLGSTFLIIARNAWVADVAVGYDDRSRHFVIIEIVGIISMLFLLLLPVYVASQGGEGDRFAQISAMGWCLIVSLPITAALAWFFVPDQQRQSAVSAEAYSVKEVRSALINPHLKTVLLLEVMIGTSISVTASLYLWVAESVFGLTDLQASFLLVVFFIASVAGLPIWMMLAARTEKHKAVCIAVLVSAASYLGYYFMAQIGGFWPFAIAAVLNGFAFTAPLVIGRSMTADVAEWEKARSGHDRAGMYFGLNSMAYKIGSSLAIGVGYLLVALVAGYKAGAENSPGAEHGLLLVFCLVPAAFYIATYFVVRNYPLNRASQQEVTDRLHARKP